MIVENIIPTLSTAYRVTCVKFVIQLRSVAFSKKNKMDKMSSNVQTFSRTESKPTPFKDHVSDKIKAFEDQEDKENIPLMSNRHQCKFCEKSFSRIEKLFKHVNSVHSKKKPIPMAEAIQNQPSNAQSDKALPHKCPLCKQRFATMVTLMNHLTLAHYKQKFTCELCDLSFPSKDIFNLHLEVDHGKSTVVKPVKETKPTEEKVKIDPDLDEPFNATLQDLNRKLENWCKTINPSVQWCEIDGQMFTTSLEYSKHLQIAHSNSKIGEDYICDFVDCYCIFESRPELKHHLQLVHSGISFNCRQCPRSFPSQQIRSLHNQVDHLGVRFVCNLCQLDFKRRKNAFAHLLSHPEIQRQGSKPVVLIPIKGSKTSKPLISLTPPVPPTLSETSTKPIMEVVDLDEVDLDNEDLEVDEDPMEEEDAPNVTTAPLSEPFPQPMVSNPSSPAVSVRDPDQNVAAQNPPLPQTSNENEPKGLEAMQPNKPYPCPHCAATFAVKGTLKNHVKARHEKIRDLKCTYCDKYFALNSSLYAHKKRWHLTEFTAERSVKGGRRSSAEYYPSMLPPQPMPMDSTMVPTTSAIVAKKSVLENVSISPHVTMPENSTGQRRKQRDLDSEIQQLYHQLGVNSNPQVVAKKQEKPPKMDHPENSFYYKCDFCPKTFALANSLYAHKKRKHPMISINPMDAAAFPTPTPSPVENNVPAFVPFDGTNNYAPTSTIGHFPAPIANVDHYSQSLPEQYHANEAYQNPQDDDVADFVLRSLNYGGF